MPYAIIGNVLKMEKTEAKKRIDFLRAEIDRHDRLYYVEARPVIGDRDYDLLYEELLRLERDYPELYSETSPTQRVSGEPISGFAQVRHEPPMQSLDKTHSKSELSDFDAMVRREVDGFTYSVEQKTMASRCHSVMRDGSLCAPRRAATGRWATT